MKTVNKKTEWFWDWSALGNGPGENTTPSPFETGSGTSL